MREHRRNLNSPIIDNFTSECSHAIMINIGMNKIACTYIQKCYQ